MRSVYAFIKSAIVCATVACVSTVQAAHADQGILAGDSSYNITYKPKTGSYKVSVNAGTIQNPFYDETLFGMKVSLVLSNKPYAFGKNMNIKTLASTYLGDFSPRTYEPDVKMSGSGKIKLKDGRYFFSILALDYANRIRDGLTFRKTASIRKGVLNIRSLGGDTIAINGSEHLSSDTKNLSLR